MAHKFASPAGWVIPGAVAGVSGLSAAGDLSDGNIGDAAVSSAFGASALADQAWKTHGAKWAPKVGPTAAKVLGSTSRVVGPLAYGYGAYKGWRTDDLKPGETQWDAWKAGRRGGAVADSGATVLSLIPGWSQVAAPILSGLGMFTDYAAENWGLPDKEWYEWNASPRSAPGNPVAGRQMPDVNTPATAYYTGILNDVASAKTFDDVRNILGVRTSE